MKKTLGIIGGMGPLSSAYLYQRITQWTDAKCDQEHIPMIIDSQTNIFDRTAFLQTGENDPFSLLLSSALFLEKANVDAIIIGCNTAHYCYEKLQANIMIPIYNMLDVVVEEIINHPHLQENVGVLGTNGLRLFPSYQAKLATNNIHCLQCNEEFQKQVNQLIYTIKAKGITNEVVAHFEEMIKKLEEQGWKHFILGCTELASLGTYLKDEEKYINSIDICAKYTIQKCGYAVKERIK
jgi:aspartate racemase